MKFTIALIAILSLAAVSQAADDKCDTFKCATVDVPAGSCIKAVAVNGKKQYNIKLQCKAEELCQMDGSDETKCTAKPTPPKVTGALDTETCDDDTNCWTGLKCTDKKCVGNAADVDCKVAQDCKVGMSCQASKCKAQITDDKTACTDDWDCVNTMTCNSDKKCVAYYSLKNGATATSAEQCESREISAEGKCQKSALQGTEWKCAADATKCKYTITTDKETKDVEKNCVCSFSDPNQQYCPADNSKLPAAQNAATGVHTRRRWPVKAQGPSWPLLEGADSCVRALASSSYIRIGVAVLAILALFL